MEEENLACMKEIAGITQPEIIRFETRSDIMMKIIDVMSAINHCCAITVDNEGIMRIFGRDTSTSDYNSYDRMFSIRGDVGTFTSDPQRNARIPLNIDHRMFREYRDQDKDSGYSLPSEEEKIEFIWSPNQRKIKCRFKPNTGTFIEKESEYEKKPKCSKPIQIPDPTHKMTIMDPESFVRGIKFTNRLSNGFLTVKKDSIVLQDTDRFEKSIVRVKIPIENLDPWDTDLEIKIDMTPISEIFRNYVPDQLEMLIQPEYPMKLKWKIAQGVDAEVVIMPRIEKKKA